MFGLNNQERTQEKRNSIRNIILHNLEEDFRKTQKTIEESSEYKNFKDVILATDPKAAALNEAINTLKAVAKEVEMSLEEYYPNGFWFGSICQVRELEESLSGHIRKERVKSFPQAFERFDSWKLSKLIDDYLTVYDDLKDVEKIVKEVSARVQ